MDTLSRTGIVVPANDGSDSTTAFRLSTRSIGSVVEANGVLWAPDDAYADRPAAGVAGRFFHPNDAGRETELYYDTGSAWVHVSPAAPTDPIAAVPGLRTLGAGAQQAASGVHEHSVCRVLAADVDVTSTSFTDLSGMTVPLAAGEYDIYARLRANGGDNLTFSFAYTGTTTSSGGVLIVAQGSSVQMFSASIGSNIVFGSGAPSGGVGSMHVVLASSGTLSLQAKVDSGTVTVKELHTSFTVTPTS